MKPEEISQLKNQLTAMHRQLSQEVKERWQRSLPFADQLLDRYERARFLGFGKGASVYDSAVVIGNVQVGENTWIGPGVILDGSGGLKIGAYCSIAAGAQLYTHDTVKWALTGGKAQYERAPVSIGDCCYVGAYVVIAKGVVIGDHSLIATGSFVNESFSPNSIIAGTPAGKIGEVIIENDDVVLRYTKRAYDKNNDIS